MIQVKIIFLPSEVRLSIFYIIVFIRSWIHSNHDLTKFYTLQIHRISASEQNTISSVIIDIRTSIVLITSHGQNKSICSITLTFFQKRKGVLEF